MLAIYKRWIPYETIAIEQNKQFHGIVHKVIAQRVHKLSIVVVIAIGIAKNCFSTFNLLKES